MAAGLAGPSEPATGQAGLAGRQVAQPVRTTW
jgi:hypothetical protein